MRKRIVSILLAALMVVSLLPTVALATETAGLDNFKKVQTYTDGKFTDVKSDDWFEKNVSSAYELNLMVGKRNDFFDTESNLTVAEAMTIAARLRSIYYTGKAEFEQGDPWYQAYTDYCKANGVADPADYDMNKAITRGEFAEIFAKALPADALKKINTVQDNMIPDVKRADKFSAAIYLLYRAGVLVGNDKKGTFAPDTNIKRVEVAAITTRMAQPALRESIRLVKPSSGGGSYTPPAPTTYTVTFDMQGHGTQIDPITNVASNAKIAAPTAPTADGYAFKGWYKTLDATTGELSDEWDFDSDTVTADITLYAKWVEAKTIADILPADFPDCGNFEWTLDIEIPEKAWANNNGFVMIKGNCTWDEGPAIFVIDRTEKEHAVPAPYLSGELTQNGNAWEIEVLDVKYSFNMENDKLVSVTVSGYTEYDGDGNGTYTAPAPTFNTVADILATVTNFPSGEGSAPDNAWKTEEGCNLYIDNGKLKAKKTSSEIVNTTTSVTKDGTNWTCGADNFSNATFTFIMTDGVLTSVTVSGSSGDVNGTYYAEVMTLQNIITEYRSNFPTTTDAGWKCSDHPNNSMYYEDNMSSYYTLTVDYINESGNTIPARIMQDSSYAHKVDGGYEYTLPNYCLIHFNIQGDNLVSVEVKAILGAYDVIAGTYTAPSN